MGLTGTTTPDLSGPGSNGNEGVLHIPQSSRTEASPSDAVQYHIQDTHWGRGSYPSAEMQLAYSTVRVDWTEHPKIIYSVFNMSFVDTPLIFFSLSMDWDIYISFSKPACPVGWGCRIHQLHFCREVRPPTQQVF